MYCGSMISGGGGALEGLASRLGVDEADVEGVENGNGDGGPVVDVSGMESDDDDLEMREASYAIVASTIWRERIRVSRRSRCNFEGLRAIAAELSVHMISSQIVIYLDQQSQERLSFPLSHPPLRASRCYWH